MAAGRPVISWEVPKRPRTHEPFTRGRAFFFSEERSRNSGQAHSLLQRDPDRARSLAEKAARELLASHTVERRVSQILSWIATGQEPDFHASADSLNILSAEEAERTARGLPSDSSQRHPANSQQNCFSRQEQRTFSWVRLNLRTTASARLPPRSRKIRSPGLARFLGCSPRQWHLCNEALGLALAYEADHPEAWKLLGDLSLELGFSDQAAQIQRLLMLRLADDPASCVRLASALLQSSEDGPAREIGTCRENGQAYAPAQDLCELVARHLPSAWSLAERRVGARPSEIPAVARFGGLGEARKLLQRKEWTAAWNATMGTIQSVFSSGSVFVARRIARPVEIAARQNLRRTLSEDAPRWKPLRDF
jgi:hypothetical protein